MNIAKRVFSIILASVMVVCMLAVSVSAESIYDTAVNLPSGKKKTFTLSSWGDHKDYKVTLAKAGTLEIKINASMSDALLYVYDSDGKELTASESNFTTGVGTVRSNSVYISWNSTTETFKCTIKYELKKGTYYIRYKKNAAWSSGKTTFTATYPSNDNEGTGEISCLTLKLDTGDSIRLGAVTEPSDANIEWSSSKSSVAAVSASGKVTAKKKGEAVISAKCGKSVAKIKIVVV